WARHFDSAHTQTAAFQLSGGGTVMTPMMHKQDSIARSSFPGGQLGVLPFDGKDLAMIVLVPNTPDGLPALEAPVSGAALSQAIAAAHDAGEEAEVVLPRFAVTSSFPLSDTLQALGITSAFDSSADFSGIDGAHDLAVGTTVHKAVITVDEQGAEAAAA